MFFMEEERKETYNRPEIRRWELIDAINKSGIPKIKGKKIAIRIKASELSRSCYRDDVDFNELLIFVRKAYLTRTVNSKEFLDDLIPGDDSYVKRIFPGCREEYIPCVQYSVKDIPCVLFNMAIRDGEIQGYMFRSHDQEITWRGNDRKKEAI